MKSEYLNWVALHEAGHAVVAAFLKDSFSYVTIKPSPRKGTVSFQFGGACLHDAISWLWQNDVSACFTR